MFVASFVSHALLGAVLAFFFILYYINGSGKWKVYFELLIGAGGNLGIIFILDKAIPIEDTAIRLSSIAYCLGAFLITTVLLLFIMAHILKGKNEDGTIRLRDILLGQYPFINKYYEKRLQEIDGKLSIPQLESRETQISHREDIISSQQNYINEELEKLNSLSEKKLRINLPENANIILNREYIEVMPSYITDIFNCIRDINLCTDSLLSKPKEQIDISTIKSYFVSLATYISTDLFGGNNAETRIHFRIYDKKSDGYIKFVAVKGNSVLTQKMTVIPYNDNSMIKRSYECKRALIKSINADYNYKSDNSRVWQDYMTYTFYGLLYDNKPFLSFGISVKNSTRYKKQLHIINYFKLESFLQDNIERVNETVDIASFLYGGEDD